MKLIAATAIFVAAAFLSERIWRRQPSLTRRAIVLVLALWLWNFLSVSVSRSLRLDLGHIALAWMAALLAWGGFRVGVHLARRKA